MDWLVVGDPVAEAIELLDGRIDVRPTLRLKVWKRMAQHLRPKRRLVAAAKQEAPETKRQFCDDAPWCLRLCVTPQTITSFANVFSAMWFEPPKGIVVPLAGQVTGGVPGAELAIQRIPEHDLEVTQDLEEARTDLGVPFVQTDRSIQVPTDGRPVWP